MTAAVHVPGAPVKVKLDAAVPVGNTVMVNIHPAAAPPVGVNATGPAVVGVPLPFSVTVCEPVVVKLPVLVKLMPPAFAAMVYAPIIVTFTWSVTVLPAVSAVPCV